MKIAPSLLALILGVISVSQAETPRPPPGMAFIPGGDYKPLYAKEAKSRHTAPFFMVIQTFLCDAE